MKKKNYRTFLIITILMSIVLFIGCAAGNDRFTSFEPAGFLFGIWHGAISVISLIIGIFSDSVSVYEANNTGAFYDFGFLIGAICCWGGSFKLGGLKFRKKHTCDKEWDEIGEKVEKKILHKINEWADVDEDTDWEEIGKKVEEKLKKKIKEWAEKD